MVKLGQRSQLPPNTSTCTQSAPAASASESAAPRCAKSAAKMLGATRMALAFASVPCELPPSGAGCPSGVQKAWHVSGGSAACRSTGRAVRGSWAPARVESGVPGEDLSVGDN
ncbi:hypothetical protein Vretimale_18028 [Volvox reticuliferus]|nr:hypothetical protein Vretimale_18028 [Volvox reticuliferus]